MGHPLWNSGFLWHPWSLFFGSTSFFFRSTRFILDSPRLRPKVTSDPSIPKSFGIHSLSFPWWACGPTMELNLTKSVHWLLSLIVVAIGWGPLAWIWVSCHLVCLSSFPSSDLLDRQGTQFNISFHISFHLTQTYYFIFLDLQFLYQHTIWYTIYSHFISFRLD